jgi:hypothetical protein
MKIEHVKNMQFYDKFTNTFFKIQVTIFFLLELGQYGLLKQFSWGVDS